MTVNKSILKFLTDIGPLVIFFLFYYNNDKNLKVAIPPLIVATIISLFRSGILHNSLYGEDIINHMLNPIFWPVSFDDFS